MHKDPKITDLQKAKTEKSRKEERINLKAEEYLSPKHMCFLFPEHFKYRTACEWRTTYNETKDTNEPIRYGPQWIYIGGKVKYKVQWIWDCLNGLEWELIRRNRKQSITS
jgi:hypothetical protein|tara:strand:- start:236 stop:565 length:330 start_codon:yes stop_codon:yes gene_type:complete